MPEAMVIALPIELTGIKCIPAIAGMMWHIELKAIKSMPVIMGMRLLTESTGIRFIRALMGIVRRIGLSGNDECGRRLI